MNFGGNKKIKQTINRIKNSTTMKSGIWYMATDFLLKGMAFITIPIFTRLLSVKDYGLVSVYTTFVGIFAIIAGLDLNTSIGTGINDFKEKKKEFLSSTIFSSLISFLVIFFSISLLFKNQLSKLFDIQKDIFVLSIISGYLSFVFNFYITIKVFEKDYKKKSLMSLINALLNIGLSIWLVTIIKNNKYYGKVYGDIIAKLILAIILFLVIVIKGKKLIWIKAWKYSFFISLPLIFHHISGMMLSQFDRLAIQKIKGLTDVGLYSYAYTLGMIPLVILGATNLAKQGFDYKEILNHYYKNITIN